MTSAMFSASDPLTLIGVSLLLFAVRVLAAYIPARSAGSIRQERCVRSDALDHTRVAIHPSAGIARKRVIRLGRSLAEHSWSGLLHFGAGSPDDSDPRDCADSGRSSIRPARV